MIEFLILAAVASWVAAAPDKKTLAARGGAAGAVRAAAATARTQARTEWPNRTNSRSAKGRTNSGGKGRTNGRTKGRASRWATGNSTGARRVRRMVRAGVTAGKAARTVTRAAVTAGRVAVAADRIAVAGVRALPEGYRAGAARAVEARERRRTQTPTPTPDPATVTESAPEAPAGDGSGYDIELERVGPLWRGRVVDGEGRTVADYMGTHRTAMEQASADIDRRVGSDAREAQARARAEQGGDEIEMTNVGPLWRSRVLNDQGQAVADHWGTHRSALERASADIDRREAVDLRVLRQSAAEHPESAASYTLLAGALRRGPDREPDAHPASEVGGDAVPDGMDVVLDGYGPRHAVGDLLVHDGRLLRVGNVRTYQDRDVLDLVDPVDGRAAGYADVLRPDREHALYGSDEEPVPGRSPLWAQELYGPAADPDGAPESSPVLLESSPVLPESAPQSAPGQDATGAAADTGLLSVPQPSAALRESLRRVGLDDEGRPLTIPAQPASSTPTPEPASAGPVNPSTTTKESNDMAEIVEFESTTDLRNEAAELEVMAEEIHAARAEFERRTKALEEKVGAAPFGTRAIAEAVTAVGEAPTTDAAAEALLQLRAAVDEADALADVAESLQAEGDVRAYAAN
jgi:hypothetical protein